MKDKRLKKLDPISLDCVSIQGGFWGPRIKRNRRTTIPYEYRQCKKTGRIDAWKLEWKPGKPNRPHQFWDSDTAKWMEAVAYSLASHYDSKLEKLLDRIIDTIVSAQRRDGYLNSYFTVVEPKNRWTNLFAMHELYCAGHLMEAAVAYYETTGKKKFLNAMCKLADHIDSRFGRGKGKKPGYPGHEEIELALMKLYHATGEKRYFKLAEYFVNERGKKPIYFDIEAKALGKEPSSRTGKVYDGAQAHLPVRKQKTADGHAVRAMYLYCAMTDVAAETGDRSLLAACRTLWKNVTERRMYITGGVGSTRHGERFTVDYDLPNDTAYAESCAAIGLIFWAQRMLQIEQDSRYADVMEKALYNGFLSSTSSDGKHFFYANPLAVDPGNFEGHGDHVACVRQEWFGCSCCPPNIARLLASLGTYAYSQRKRDIWVHLYTNGTADFDIGAREVIIEQKTDYPWKGKVLMVVRPQEKVRFTLALRIPGWCEKPRLKINGRGVRIGRYMKKGYARISRLWKKGDTVELSFPMKLKLMESHPAVRSNRRRVAIQRGPLVYCLEQTDNGPDLDSIVLPDKTRLSARFEPGLLGGITVVTGRALREEGMPGKKGLYRTSETKKRPFTFKAVPYFAWANRRPGEMIVWIRRG